jgi:Peptidase M15
VNLSGIPAGLHVPFRKFQPDRLAELGRLSFNGSGEVMMKVVAVVALAVGLSACAIQGPPDDEPGDGVAGDEIPGDDNSATGDDGNGSAVGDPTSTDGEPDPVESEPGPDDLGEEPPPEDPPAEDPAAEDPPQANNAGQVCYPGQDNSYTTCFPTVPKSSSFPSGYNYPSHSSASYQPPLRFLDLSGVSASTKVAPNFTVGELMQSWKGKYGVYQVHMVDKIQSIRSQTGGALHVNSGYRNPSYNSSVGGATYSRHMYGDAVDMWSSATSLNGLKTRCNNLGADYVGMYSSHIHCDWRYASKDPSFYGSADWQGGPLVHDHSDLPEHAASLALVADVWTAPADDFDEGEPYREWTAFDENGQIIEVVAAEAYIPPADAAIVEVMVGGQTMLRANADDPSNWMELPRGMVQVRLDTVAQPSDVYDDVIEDWSSLVWLDN